MMVCIWCRRSTRAFPLMAGRIRLELWYASHKRGNRLFHGFCDERDKIGNAGTPCWNPFLRRNPCWNPLLEPPFSAPFQRWNPFQHPFEHPFQHPFPQLPPPPPRVLPCSLIEPPQVQAQAECSVQSNLIVTKLAMPYNVSMCYDEPCIAWRHPFT